MCRGQVLNLEFGVRFKIQDLTPYPLGIPNGACRAESIL